MSRSLQESSLLNTTDYRSLSVGSVPTSEYLIATTVVGATPAATVDFDVSDYSNVYRHLKLVMVARSNRSANTDSINLKFNNSTANYRYHALRGSDATVVSFNGTPSYIDLSFIPAANEAAADNFGPKIVDILDVFSTSKHVTTRTLWGQTGDEYWTGLFSGGWFDTSLITTITLECNNGSFVEGSRFSLYGVTA